MPKRKRTATKSQTIKKTLSFAELLQRNRPNRELNSGLLLAIDPGKTTGYAVFLNGILREAEQISNTTHSKLNELIEKYYEQSKELITHQFILVVEDYFLYPWALKEQSWSTVPTLRLIGGIEFLYDVKLRHNNTKFILQTAKQAKGFCNNQKLQEWGFYQKGKQHANDAIRHAATYYLFGKD